MDTSNPALDLLERDITERLAPVCRHMSAESFQELVRDIVRVKLKYGPQSLATEQLHGPIAEFVILASSTQQTEDVPGNST
jgi:hypothetical protein